MNDRLRANLGRSRPVPEDNGQTTQQQRHSTSRPSYSGHHQQQHDVVEDHQYYDSPSWEAELLEEYQEEPDAAAVAAETTFANKVRFAMYHPDWEDDIRSMDFFCQGGFNVLPAPTTILERPRVAPPTPEPPRVVVSSTSSSRKSSDHQQQQQQHRRLKLSALFGLPDSEPDKERRRRRQQEEAAELERQALEVSRKLEAKRQRNLERDREREYLVRKEAERQCAAQHKRTPPAEQVEYYEPIVVDLGASTPSSSRSGHRSKSTKSHSDSHSHSHSHSHSKSHSHSRSRNKDHKHSHGSTSHKHHG